MRRKLKLKQIGASPNFPVFLDISRYFHIFPDNGTNNYDGMSRRSGAGGAGRHDHGGLEGEEVLWLGPVYYDRPTLSDAREAARRVFHEVEEGRPCVAGHDRCAG